MTGIEMIAAERRRQLEQKGFTAEHDDLHAQGELALAGATYAAAAVNECEHMVVSLQDYGNGLFEDCFPWDPQWDKRDERDQVTNLVVAGALIAAEIDRLLRRQTRAVLWQSRMIEGFGRGEL